MAGEDMIRRILEIRGDARVLVCSGYFYDISRLPTVRQDQFGYLPKPFLGKMLVEAVDRMLGVKRPASS
jgi:DNA-binding NarL/FixJ family response regulator